MAVAEGRHRRQLAQDAQHLLVAHIGVLYLHSFLVQRGHEGQALIIMPIGCAS